MSEADLIAIKVDGLNKTFKLPHEKQSSVKSMFVGLLNRNKSYEQQHVLKDISFEIKKGEFFGIAGRNGSGKSTLLKLLAGIYTPNNGSIVVNGSLTPFIELGVGFNPELTGRENVYLNGALLGFNRKDMDEMYDEIVAFAELSRFMDQKLKNYSSGMQVRLAFSIAIRAKSDILLIDEVLAVGDAAFQKKCFDVFRVLKKEKRTIILVTHDMGNVERFCDRALVLDQGEILSIGSPEKTSSIYARLNVKELSEGADGGDISGNRSGSGEVRVKQAYFSNDNKKTTTFSTGDTVTFNIILDRKKGYENVKVECGLAIFSADGVNICGPNTEKTKLKPNCTSISFQLPDVAFGVGEYTLTLAIYDKNTSAYYDLIEKKYKFTVISDHVTHGLVEVPALWKAN